MPVSAMLPENMIETTGSPVPLDCGPETDRPRTALGERLGELRARAIADGMRLLSWDDIEEELRQRRGYLSADW